MAMRPRGGMIKKTSLAEYAKIRANGLIAISLLDGDELRWVGMTRWPERHHPGHPEGPVQPASTRSRSGHGPRYARRHGIRLKKGDEVIGMEIVQPSAELLVVTEQGRQAHTAGRLPGQASGHRWRDRQLAEPRHRRRGRGAGRRPRRR